MPGPPEVRTYIISKVLKASIERNNKAKAILRAAHLVQAGKDD